MAQLGSSLERKCYLETQETVVSLLTIRRDKQLSRLEESKMQYFVIGKRFHLIVVDKSV